MGFRPFVVPTTASVAWGSQAATGPLTPVGEVGEVSDGSCSGGTVANASDTVAVREALGEMWHG